MKILVLQLARLGDIYQSWPALRALERRFPHAQIDVMVRSRFEGALTGLEVVSNRILLPTQELFSPLLMDAENIEGPLARLGYFIDDLRKENYDVIVNLSFSPLSSYLTHAAQVEKTEVVGYSRHADGYFNMIGEVSSYFYAQVGTDRHNRIHLTELFSTMVGTDLEEADWADPGIMNSNLALPDKYVVFHVGASEQHKSLPLYKWARILRYFIDAADATTKVVLIGSKSEKSLADIIVGSAGSPEVVDLVGETQISDLFPILRGAHLLVGCDSAPIHVAAFTNTPVLNLSLGQVNFWETGPRSPRSFIMRGQTADQIESEVVVASMLEILDGRDPAHLIRYSSEIGGYEVRETPEERFNWNLITAIYMGSSFPITDDIHFFNGCEKLNEINNVILENVANIKKVGLNKVKPILDRCDEVVEAIGAAAPQVQIYIRWLKAERARMSPGNFDQLVTDTTTIHLNLKSLLRPYILEESEQEGGTRG